MSAEQSATAAQPPSGDGNNGSNFLNGGVHQPVEGQPEGQSVEGHSVEGMATADLANLLANGQWADTAYGLSADVIDTSAYDGHVALALDTGVLPDLDSTLDLLTSSHHLFDVPALDVSGGSSDASSA